MAASAVLAVIGWASFTWSIAIAIAACALASAVMPRGFALYAFAALALTFVVALRDGAPAAAFVTILIACSCAALGGRLLADSRAEGLDAPVAKRLRRLAFLMWALTLFPLYPAAKLGWVRIQVGRFCTHVEPGDPVVELQARARRLGLETTDRPAAADASTPATLSAWQGFAFARTFCEVEHDGTRATRARSTSLD
ncbi:MAG: hypothetical protein ACOY0T_02375 [Myxococcota bacterium]